MDAMTSTRAGRPVTQQGGRDGYAAFVPAPLPPEPAIAVTPELRRLEEEAAHALGKLEGVSATIDPDRLLYMYVRKEAVLSSQIEGTRSTLTDLLQYEAAGAEGTPVADVREVSSYVTALYHGLEAIQTGRLPLSLRLLRELHGVLVSGRRGGDKAPGEFRRTQNWIGGTRPGNARFVPPPPHELMPALGNLEGFLHDEYGPTPALQKAGLAHVQFETIHPFLDGNGRIGRLLISLVLVTERLLTRPFFYLSLYFKENRADYYDALQRVRTHGDWEGWLHFYLVGVASIANRAAETTLLLRNLFEADQQRVLAHGKAAKSTLTVYDLFRRRIVVSPGRAAEETGLTLPTVRNAIQNMEELRIVRETTGRKWGRLYVYSEQLRILNDGP